MIRRKDEMGPVTRHELQKGVGDITFHTFVTREEAYGPGRTFARIVFEPGTPIGIREHHGEFEGYCILKGQALVADNSVGTVLNPGDYRMCKGGGNRGIGRYEDETMEIITLIVNVPA